MYKCEGKYTKIRKINLQLVLHELSCVQKLKIYISELVAEKKYFKINNKVFYVRIAREKMPNALKLTNKSDNCITFTPKNKRK